MVRLAAVLLFVLLAPAAVAAEELDVLIQRLESKQAATRLDAVTALREREATAERRRALPGLLRTLADPVAAVRREAAVAVGGYADPGAAGALQARLEVEPDAAVLAAVALALGRVGAHGAVPRLTKLATSHPVASVRAAALTALGDLGGATARATALEVITGSGPPDPGWSVRAAAMLTLARCGRADDLGPVLTAYREGDGAKHWFARAALAELVGTKDREPLPLLLQLVLDPDPRVAVTAASGIAKTGRQQEMLVLLRHTSPPVRVAAASAVARERVAYAYPRLRTIARFDRSTRVRWAASLALFRIEDPEGDDLVVQALQAKEPTIWVEAVAALARRTGKNYGRNASAWREALRRWRKERGR